MKPDFRTLKLISRGEEYSLAEIVKLGKKVKGDEPFNYDIRTLFDLNDLRLILNPLND